MGVFHIGGVIFGGGDYRHVNNLNSYLGCPLPEQN